MIFRKFEDIEETTKEIIENAIGHNRVNIFLSWTMYITLRNRLYKEIKEYGYTAEMKIYSVKSSDVAAIITVRATKIHLYLCHDINYLEHNEAKALTEYNYHISM